MYGRVAKAAVQSALTFKLLELSSSLVRVIFFEGALHWAGPRERVGSIFSNHQHFAISTDCMPSPPCMWESISPQGLCVVVKEFPCIIIVYSIS